MPLERCPVCGTKVKSENLARHMKRIHPDEEAVGKKRPRTKTSRKGIVIFIVLIFVLSSIVSAIVLWPKPDVGAFPNPVEMGTIPDQPTTVLVDIENIGNADLKITGLRTSCICTSVLLELRGQNSPTFTGPEPDVIWLGVTMGPGESGTLEITYDPTMFGDVGPTRRYVYVASNDPDTPELEIELRAVVQP
jgi:hypothetical protein